MLCVSKSYILSLTFILSFTISFLSAGSRNVGVKSEIQRQDALRASLGQHSNWRG